MEWKELNNRNRSINYENVNIINNVVKNFNITDRIGRTDTITIIPASLGAVSIDGTSGNLTGFSCTGLALIQNYSTNINTDETTDGYLIIEGGDMDVSDNFSINATAGVSIVGPLYQTYELSDDKFTTVP